MTVDEKTIERIVQRVTQELSGTMKPSGETTTLKYLCKVERRRIGCDACPVLED